MAFADTLTLTDAEDTAPVAKRISDDKNSSMFLVRDTDHDYRVEVSHLKEKNSGYERHLLRISKEVHKSNAQPAHAIQAYVVVRFQPGSSVQAAKVGQALGHVLSDANLGKLVDWEV